MRRSSSRSSTSRRGCGRRRTRPSAATSSARPSPCRANLAKADSLAKEAVAAQVGDRTQALFRLLLALRDDLLGRHEQALTQLKQTAGELTSWGERGEGKEILYYLMARQALFLKRYDEAEGFATQALASNPAYPRAYVVLGGVGVRRAQELSVFQSLAEAGPLDQADAAYAKAVELATAADDRRMELIARLGMAGGHVTRGNLLFGLNTPEDDPEAARWLEQVVAETRPLLAPLEEIKQYRLLAQANSYLGIAAWRLAALAERQNDAWTRAWVLHPGAGCAGRVRGSGQTLARGSDAGRNHHRGILHARQTGSPQGIEPVVARRSNDATESDSCNALPGAGRPARRRVRRSKQPNALRVKPCCHACGRGTRRGRHAHRAGAGRREAGRAGTDGYCRLEVTRTAGSDRP